MSESQNLEKEIKDIMDKKSAEHKEHSRILPCIVCGVVKESVGESGYDNYPERFEHQPYGATTFYTYGHYGSTFWDSFDGEQLVLCVCDDCLRKNHTRLTAIRTKRQHPSIHVELSEEERADAIQTPESHEAFMKKMEEKDRENENI